MHEGWESEIEADDTIRYHVSEPNDAGNLALILVKRAGRSLLDGENSPGSGVCCCPWSLESLGGSGTFCDGEE